MSRPRTPDQRTLSKGTTARRALFASPPASPKPAVAKPTAGAAPKPTAAVKPTSGRTARERTMAKLKTQIKTLNKKLEAVQEEPATEQHGASGDRFTAPPLSTKHEKLLQKVWCTDGHCYGRDATFHYLQRHYTDTPSLRQTNDWIQSQKLQQLYSQTRSGGTTNNFTPGTPWNSISIDLIDFTNKPSKNFRYILVAIDNFSRYMVCRKLTDKTAEKTAIGLNSLLDEVKKKFGVNAPKHAIMDDGSEFKGDAIKVMEKQGMEKRRTLGGHPFQNGMVERANGKVKMLLAKLKEIRGGGWSDNLDAAVKSYNEQLNRTGGMAPVESVKLDKEAQKKHRAHIIDNNNARSVDFMVRRPLEVGTRVRLKLAKSKLDKASVPSWSAAIYTIEKVVKHKTPTVAPYYVIKDRAPDLRYSRNDLLPIEGTPQEIPKPPPVRETRALRAQNEIDEGAFTRARKRHAADALATKRATRSDAPTPTAAPPPEKKKQAAPKYKKGELVRVKHPEGMFDGVVKSSTAKRTVIYFAADGTQDTFLPKEYNSIEMR